MLNSPRRSLLGLHQAASAQHAEIALADAAFHAQQQPIVGTAWIVDAVEVDHARLDQPAQLEKMIPIASITGQPGGVET